MLLVLLLFCTTKLFTATIGIPRGTNVSIVTSIIITHIIVVVTADDVSVTATHIIIVYISSRWMESLALDDATLGIQKRTLHRSKLYSVADSSR